MAPALFLAFLVHLLVSARTWIPAPFEVYWRVYFIFEVEKFIRFIPVPGITLYWPRYRLMHERDS